MLLKLKIFIGYTILALLSIFIIYQFRKEQMQRHTLRKEEKELAAIHRLAEKNYISLLDLSTYAEIAITWDNDDLREYRRKRRGVCDSLQLLKEYVHTPLHKSHIDSLCLLLRNKELLLFKAVHTFKELQSIGDIVQESIPAIVSTAWKQAAQQKENVTLLGTDTKDFPKKKRSIWDIFYRKNNKSAYWLQREEAERKRQSLSIPSLTGTTMHMLRSLNERGTMERAERQARLLTQMDSLYASSTELNGKMKNMVSEFERENNERFTVRYKNFVLERDNSYYMVVSLALFVSLLAIMLYTIVHRDLNRRLRYERELEQSDRRNRELLRSRKELMASVAHDLRAPLAAIKGCAELLPLESDSDRRTGYLGNILHSSDYMLGLINTLMEYHRIDEGRIRSNDTAFCLKVLFEKIADSYQLIARQKNLKFTSSFSGLNVIVCCDSSHILQIANNLLSNALKFTHYGEVHFEVEYLFGKLQISVQDTGVGISFEEKERIFDAFERLDNARNIPGFGLGLAIIARLVSEMGGSVDVKSTPGEGSRFSVSLPVLSAEQPTRSEENKLSAYQQTGDICVLVMDDNRILLEITREMFSRRQIDCECCTDIRELTDCLRRQKYDLLLTDIQMLGADGFSVLRLLRCSDIPWARELPVIAVTARFGDSEEFLSAGFAGCLYKPFSEEELLATTLYIDRLDFTAIMEGEKNKEEMLDIFIEDTTEELSEMQEAFSIGNYEKLRCIIHKAAPLWEMIHINIPQNELKRMASMTSEKWSKVSNEEIEKLIKAVEQAVEKAKRLKSEWKPY